MYHDILHLSNKAKEGVDPMREAVCIDCQQFGEVERVHGYDLCVAFCAEHTGQNPAQLRRLQRALDRAATQFARDHSFLIDPEWRSE